MDKKTRIVHVSDLHLEPAGKEQYAGLAARLERISEVVAGLEPDFVVATGDLTNRGSHQPADFQLAKQWLEELQIPYLATPGNHDLGANRTRSELFPDTEHYEARPYPQTGYAQIFGRKVVTRAVVGDLSIFGIALREDDPDGALERLERMLAKTAGPVVVAGHYPAVPARPWPCTGAFGAQGYVDDSAPRLAQIILNNHHVIAYLCGHVHVTSKAPIGAHCQQFTAGGLGPGAAALRIYEWDGQTWSYSTNNVDGPQHFWETFSELARENPHFSSGTPTERTGTWSPPLNDSNEAVGTGLAH